MTETWLFRVSEREFGPATEMEADGLLGSLRQIDAFIASREEQIEECRRQIAGLKKLRAKVELGEVVILRAP